MGRTPELLKRNDGVIEKAIQLKESTDLTVSEIAKQLNVDYQQLIRALGRNRKNIIPKLQQDFHKIEIIKTTKLPAVMERNMELQNLSLTQSIDYHQMLISKINELEKFVSELKKPDSGKVDSNYYREYLVAWKQVTDSLQWIIDRRIKLQETLENQIFRSSIIDAIKEEEPQMAAKIKVIIDKKRKEHGLL
jgi:hypothetical protein